MADFVPQNPTELKAFVDNFINVTSGTPTHFGITAGDVTALTTASGALGNAITDKINKESAFRASVGSLTTSAHSIEALIRSLVKRVQIATTVTDADRLQLRINVRDTVPTHASVGIEVPGLEINVVQNVVVVHFGTSPLNENTNHLPAWAIGCNIYRKLHTDTAFTLVNFDTASPYEDSVTWAAQEVQYQVAYRGRRANEVGAISQPVTVVCGHV